MMLAHGSSEGRRNLQPKTRVKRLGLFVDTKVVTLESGHKEADFRPVDVEMVRLWNCKKRLPYFLWHRRQVQHSSSAFRGFAGFGRAQSRISLENDVLLLWKLVWMLNWVDALTEMGMRKECTKVLHDGPEQWKTAFLLGFMKIWKAN